MKKIIFSALFLCTLSSFAQGENCTYGVTSENGTNAVNVATGGSLEYGGAADFIVPFGKVLNVNQITVNLFKGNSDLSFVNVKLLNELNGFPNEVLASYDNMVPTSQEFAFEIEPGFSSYKITLDLPQTTELQKGKYFVQISAVPGGEGGVWWEITEGLNQSLGIFDLITFDKGETWGGTGFSDYVFSVNGVCTDSGEVAPELGDVCSQGDVTNLHEVGADIIFGKVADDFIVPANTTFNLNHLDMFVLSQGAGINTATVNLRSSVDDAPGPIIQSFENIAPTQEQYFDYWPWTGNPPMVPALKWYFDFEPVALTEGRYFIEVVPNPYFTDAIQWEGTSQGTNGGYSYTSFDGVNWTMNEGYNQVFNVSGFCQTTLGVKNQDKTTVNFYPNPVENVLNISSANEIKSVEVYTLLGQKIATFNNPTTSVNVENFSAGMYLVKTTLQNGATETMKIIKK